MPLKIPLHLKFVATLPCEMVKATIENKTTSVTAHFKSASSSSRANTLDIWCKNCSPKHFLEYALDCFILLFFRLLQFPDYLNFERRHDWRFPVPLLLWDFFFAFCVMNHYHRKERNEIMIGLNDTILSVPTGSAVFAMLIARCRCIWRS